MNSLQLASTLAAYTGTGLLYTPYEQGSDRAVWKNGAGATRSTLTLKRVQPIPTPTFPGVERLEVRRTSYVTVGTAERVIVCTFGISVPADIPQADRSEAVTQFLLATRIGDFVNVFDNGTFPS